MTDTTQRIEPLSAAEEAAIREAASWAVGLPADHYSGGESPTVLRLLATLDRDRSAANERLAQLVRAAEMVATGLLADRPALRTPYADTDAEWHKYAAGYLRDAISAALGATETEPGEGERCDLCGKLKINRVHTDERLGAFHIALRRVDPDKPETWRLSDDATSD